MLKKIFAMATMLCVLPVIAHAWTLNTWVKSQGGTMLSSNLSAAVQTVANGSVSKSYTTTGNEVVTITPAAGFKISKLEINGINQTVALFPSLATPELPQVVSRARTSTVRVYATFVRQSVTLSAVAGADGSVDKAAISPVYIGPQTPSKTFIFTPTPGFAVTGIAVSAGTLNVDYQFVNAMTNNPTSLGVVDEKVKVNVANVNSAMSFSATFGGTSTAPASSSSGCESCHKSQGVGAGVYAAWSSSMHKTGNVQCYACHIGSNTGAHPGATATVTTCENCHNTTLSTTTHPAELTASKCIECHDSHNPAAGIPSLAPTAHPAVTLYTFEEIGMQMAGGAKVPVQVDANGKGMPYSPKQTCGTAGCHVKNGVDYTYDKISDHSFHSNEGRSEYVDSSDGKFNATKNKPWTQSTAMVGKW